MSLITLFAYGLPPRSVVRPDDTQDELVEAEHRWTLADLQQFENGGEGPSMVAVCILVAITVDNSKTGERTGEELENGRRLVRTQSEMLEWTAPSWPERCERRE